MKQLVMFLFGEYETDARVKRTVSALKESYEISLICESANQSNDMSFYCYGKNGSTLEKYIKSILLFFRVVKSKQVDVIYGQDFYSIIPLSFVLDYAKRRNIMTVYDAHELIIDPNIPKLSKMSIISRLEKKLFQKVDKCVCADEMRGNIMIDTYGYKRKIHVFHNISSLVMGKEKPIDILSCLNSSKTKVIYAGAMSKNRGLVKLVSVISSYSNIQLIFIGNGSEKDNIIQECEKCGVDYLMYDAIPHNMLYYVLSQCDIGYVVYDNSNWNNIYSASNKIYEYISAGIAILANDNKNLERIVRKYDVGVAGIDLKKNLDQIIGNIKHYKNNTAQINVPQMELVEELELRKFIIGD